MNGSDSRGNTSLPVVYDLIGQPVPLIEKLLVLLRDGRKLLGILRSFDQFANAVLEGACERVIVGDLYCDIPLGLYVICGENVVLIGELSACEDALLEASLYGEVEAVQLLICSDMPRPDVAAHTLVISSSRGYVDVATILIEISGETIGEVKAVADMHERKSEMARHSSRSTFSKVGHSRQFHQKF